MPAQATADEQLALLTIIAANPDITMDALIEKSGLTRGRFKKVITSPGNRNLFKTRYTQGEYALTHNELPVSTITYTISVRGRYVLAAQNMSLKLTAADVINREFARLGISDTWVARVRKYRSYGPEELSLTKYEGDEVAPSDVVQEYPDAEKFLELVAKLDSAVCGSLDVIDIILESVQMGHEKGHSDGYSEGVSDGERYSED